MLGMVARHKRNKTNKISNSYLVKRNYELDILTELNYRNIRAFIREEHNELYNNILEHIKNKNIEELNKKQFKNDTALIYCIKNINTNYKKNFRKKSYAKLIIKLIELNVDLLKLDSNGRNGLMILCKSITKNKYLNLINIYLEYCNKFGVLNSVLGMSCNSNSNIYDYIRMNISKDKKLKNKIQDLILCYL